METRRFMLIAVLGVVIYFMYQAWQDEYGPSSGGMSPAAFAAAAAAAQPAGGGVLVVSTDRLLMRVDLASAEVRQVQLLDYAVTMDHPENKLALLDDQPPHWFVFQDGLLGADGKAAALSCSSDRDRYVIAPGADTLDVPLHCRSGQDWQVEETLHLQRGSYVIGVDESVTNTSAQARAAALFAGYERSKLLGGKQEKFMSSFFGVALYEQEDKGSKYLLKQAAFDKLDKEPVEVTQTGGWIAMMQHYFVAGIIPPTDQPVTLRASHIDGDRYSAAVQLASAAFAPQAKRSTSWKLYIGPKLQSSLPSVAPGFERTEDYGSFRLFFAKPLFQCLAWLYNHVTHNWGTAIILLTLGVKILFYPLSEAQFRSAAKMRKFGPRIKELRERFGSDRERLQKAMMDLYKKEGFNPLAGCWPILLQFPIFLALYSVLAQSVELRHAGFGLWLKDLSAPDPYYVMPVLYGFSMWVQQRQSGQSATMDPTQAKMMNVMPIALTGLFAFFPAGLVLYWFVSNIIGIGQQYVINRRIARDDERARR